MKRSPRLQGTSFYDETFCHTTTDGRLPVCRCFKPEHQLRTYTVVTRRCIMDAWNSGGDTELWKSFIPHMN